MKAKEYAKIAIEGNCDLDSISEIVMGLMTEISSITKARNVSTLAGVNRVVQEIRQKWTAICRRTEGLNEKGFDRFLMDKGLINRDGTLDTDLLIKKYMGA